MNLTIRKTLKRAAFILGALFLTSTFITLARQLVYSDIPWQNIPSFIGSCTLVFIGSYVATVGAPLYILGITDLGGANTRSTKEEKIIPSIFWRTSHVSSVAITLLLVLALPKPHLLVLLAIIGITIANGAFTLWHHFRRSPSLSVNQGA